jgi:hypothetical protein
MKAEASACFCAAWRKESAGGRSLNIQDSNIRESRNSKSQASKLDPRDLELGSWNFSGVWRLEFEVSFSVTLLSACQTETDPGKLAHSLWFSRC